MTSTQRQRHRSLAPLIRYERLEEIFREELEFILESEVGDIALANTRIERVNLTQNQSRADVWFVCRSRTPAEALAALDRARSFLRYRLTDAISLKRIPELRFFPLLERETPDLDPP